MSMRYAPPPEEPVPAGSGAAVRWLAALAMLLLAEAGARAAVSLRLVEAPVLYNQVHMQRKKEAWQEEFLPAREPGDRYLVLGSSIAHTNIDPVSMSGELKASTGWGWTGFNGGMFACRFEDFLFFADWYWREWKFRHLVVVIEPWSTRPGHMPIIDRLAKPRLEQWLMEHSGLMALRGQWRPYDWNNTARHRGLIALDEETTMHGWTRTVQRRRLAEWDREERAKEQAEDMLLRIEGQPAVPMVPTVDRVFEMREWAARHGVRLWWVIPPMRPDLDRHFPRQFQHAEWKKFVERVADAPNNHVVDMWDLCQPGGALADHALWWDGNHLTSKGALVYSRILGRRIGDWARTIE